MQDVQNIPNPDVNSTVRDKDFCNYSETDEEKIPLPDNEPKPAPVEEPPNPDMAEIDEDDGEPQRIF